MRNTSKFGLFIAASTLALAGCGEAGDQTSAPAVELEEPASAPAANDAQATAANDLPGEIAVSLPQLAYAYDFGFSLPGADVRRLQRQHADLCEQQGPASCQIAGMTTQGDTEDNITGELQLLVATRHARDFGALIEAEAESAGADPLSADIATEEVSRTIVDTEAQLASRIELRDRLRQVLRTRRGSVEDLIAAERSVAEVNTEIDRARSWLAETRNRVAYSQMTIRYESANPVGANFLSPVQGAIGSLGSILGWLFAVLIVGTAIVVPVASVIWAAKRITRRLEASS